MSYILITPLSIFPKDRAKIEYAIKVPGCNVSSIEAEQTNESILRCVSCMQDVKQHGGIDRIIVLCSNKTLKSDDRYGKSVYEYYQQVAYDCGLHPEFTQIMTEEVSFPQAVEAICSLAHEGDTVYIDGAGGLRTTSNIIQIVAKMLRYLGIHTPHTLYASIQNSPTIETTENFARMIDLADAFHEFMTTGKADQLIECFHSCPHDEMVEDLLSAMSEFSDKIRIGDVDTIDSTTLSLHSAISAIRTAGPSALSEGLESVILQQFIPLIEEKLIGTNAEVDYPRLVKWCLDNVLIQQALTIFVEKMPIYLFANEIVGTTVDMRQVKEEHATRRESNKLLNAAWEVDAFFVEMLAERSLIDECVDYLKGKESTNPLVLQGMKNIRFFCLKRNWNTPFKDLPLGPTRSLKRYIEKQKFATYEKLVAHLCNNKKPEIWCTIIGTTADQLGLAPSENIAAKKLHSLNKILKSSTLPAPYYTKVPIRQFYDVVLGYIYVKALRNQTNHASSDENLDSYSKKVFEGNGYDCSNSDLQTIRKNIYRALNAITSVVKPQ